ncbi:hypothetical protein I4U23_024746 [Adineta vaga]|nr:hypothetical protein I4U23_024746 [Adineta vaga]
MEFINEQLIRYIQPVIIILGTIGALLNQLLFYSRKQLRSTSCALYFRVMAANDLLVIWCVILTQWLDVVFDINPANQYEWYCKLFSYLTYVFYSLSPYFLVLVCFDRLCTSSTNARLRKISTIHIASFIIPVIIIIICLAYLHVLVWFKLIVIPSDQVCKITDLTYNNFLAIFLLCMICFTPPILMIIFCSITFILLRQQRHRIMPVNQSRLRHRDNQLLKMLFIYVTWNIICTVPFATTYLIVIRNQDRLSPTLDFLFQIFHFLIHLIYATSFYIYTLGTPFYRAELFSLFKTIYRRFQQLNNKDNHMHIRRVTNMPGD